MSDVKFSSLITASYLHGNDYIAIVRSGSSTDPTTLTAPNNYIVQAKNFTASFATTASHSISSSHAKMADYAPTNSDISASAIKVMNISASGYVSASNITASTSMTSPIGNFTNFTASNMTASGYVSASIVVASTSMISPIGNFTNLTASNITASGYVSASKMVASTSMTSPIGNFTNFTASNITASGYISASSVTAVDFHGTASYATTASYVTTASYALRSGDDPDSLTTYTPSGGASYTFQGMPNTFYKVYVKGGGGGSAINQRYANDGSGIGGDGGDGAGAEGFIKTGASGQLLIVVGRQGLGGTLITLNGTSGELSMVQSPDAGGSIVATGGAGGAATTSGGEHRQTFGVDGADGVVIASTNFFLVQSNVDLLPLFGKGGITAEVTNWNTVGNDTRSGYAGAVFITSL